MNINLENIVSAWSLKKNLHTLLIRENDRWAFLDGYRAIGIFWVILGHCVSYPQYSFGMEKWSRLIEQTPVYLQWVFNGDVAVDGFFMVSAFLMTNLLLKQHQETGSFNTKLFYLSRFLRLTPVYFLTLIIYSLVAKDNINLWPNFFYIQNFFNNYDAYALPYTWSLAVEEQFYLLLPLYLIFILLKTRHPFSHLISLLIISLLIRAFIILNDPVFSEKSIKGIIFNQQLFAHYFVTLYDNSYTRFGAFIGGIAVAFAYRYKNEGSQKLLDSSLAGPITIVAMVTALTLCLLPVLMEGFELPQYINIVLNIARRTVVCLCAAWLLFCGLFSSHHAKRFNKAMSSRFFYPFGHLLYAMYLFHYLSVDFVMRNMNYNFRLFQIDYMTHLELWMGFAGILSILLASLLACFAFLLLEAPIMNLRPRYHN